MNTDEATWSGPNRLRTSDTEREQVAEILRAAMTEGRLTLEEGEERLAAVYAAKYRDELQPAHRRPARQRPPGARRRRRRRRRDTPGRAPARRASWSSRRSLLTGLWVLSGAHFFWPIIPLFFLFMGLRAARPLRPLRAAYQLPSQRVAPWNAPGSR